MSRWSGLLQKRRWNRSVGFLREVRQELAKVTWPSRKEVIGYSIVVLIAVAVLGSVVFVLDRVFDSLLIKLFVR